jgi:dihydropteroate synthase type 2
MTTIFGILNITDDSFFDGGKYLEPAAAIAQGRALAADGADVIDIGAASSNPESKGVAPEVEIARLQSVLPSLGAIPLSIDTFAPAVQRWALDRNVTYLNDIQGFSDAALYPLLAASPARLIVMHSVQERGAATRVNVPASEIMDRIVRFFDQRLAVLEKAGIARSRLIIDPGMGFFLGSDPEASFVVLRNLARLKQRFGLPMLVSVSRKSFLRHLVGRDAAAAAGVSLAAELYAVRQGADFIRTHTPGALKDALVLAKMLDGPPEQA